MLVLVAGERRHWLMAMVEQLMLENSDGLNFLQRQTWTIQKVLLLPRHRRHLQLELAQPLQVTSSFRSV